MRNVKVGEVSDAVVKVDFYMKKGMRGVCPRAPQRRSCRM